MDVHFIPSSLGSVTPRNVVASVCRSFSFSEQSSWRTPASSTLTLAVRYVSTAFAAASPPAAGGLFCVPPLHDVKSPMNNDMNNKVFHFIMIFTLLRFTHYVLERSLPVG